MLERIEVDAKTVHSNCGLSRTSSRLEVGVADEPCRIRRLGDVGKADSLPQVQVTEHACCRSSEGMQEWTNTVSANNSVIVSRRCRWPASYELAKRIAR